MCCRLVKTRGGTGREGVLIAVSDGSEDSIRLGGRLDYGTGYGACRATGNVVDILLLAFWNIRSNKVKRNRTRSDHAGAIQRRPFGIGEREDHTNAPIL